MRFGHAKTTPAQERVAQIFAVEGDESGNAALVEAVVGLSARERLQFTYGVELLVRSIKETKRIEEENRLAEEKRIWEAQQARARLEAEAIEKRRSEADKERISSAATARAESTALLAVLVLLFGFAGIAALIYGYVVPGSFIDSSGWKSHSVDTSITVQANWLSGESKECTSVPTESGDAFSELICDEGPKHNMTVTFYGMRNQLGKTAVLWSCRKTDEGFVCKQTGALP